MIESGSVRERSPLGLHFKIMVVTSVVLLALFLLVGWLTMTSEAVYLRDLSRSRALLTLEGLCASARQAYFAEQFAELRTFIRALSRVDEDLVAAEVRDRRGAIAFRSDPRSVAPDETTVELSRTFYVNRMRAGSVRVVYRVRRLDLALQRMGGLLLAGFLASVLALGLTVHLAVKHLVSRPLEIFIDTASRIRGGDLDRRIDLEERRDEIGTLARAFNGMVGSLRLSLAEIERMNAALEGRVTERTRELRHQEARSESILSSLADGLVTLDRAGLVTYWNPAAERLLDVPSGEALGRPGRDLLHEAGERRVLDRVLAGGDGGCEETVLVRLDGDNLPVLVAWAPLRGPDGGEGMGTVVSRRDTPRLHELNEQVRRSDRLSSLGVLAAGLAHELNNPLGNVSTYSQLLLERASRGEEPPAAWAETIRRETERASRIVGRLLEFSRREPPARHPMDLRQPLEAARDLLLPTLGKDGVTLTLTLPESPAPVVGDGGQLQQVFINLVTNAAQSMAGAGGTVEISLAPDPERPAWWLAEVADRGAGIAEEDRDRVFNPFFTTKDVGRGTGLGLSVSYGILDEHGGEIGFRNRPGGGTVFSVRLPSAPAAEGRDAS